MRSSRRSLTSAGSGVPSSVQLEDPLASGITLGIRKTTHDLDSVPLITPTSPARFFNRLSPRRRSIKKPTPPSGEAVAGAEHPRLGIQRNPFLVTGIAEELSSPRTETSTSPSSAGASNCCSNASSASSCSFETDSVPRVTPIAADSSESSARGDEVYEQAMHPRNNKRPVLSVLNKVHPLEPQEKHSSTDTTASATMSYKEKEKRMEKPQPETNGHQVQVSNVPSNMPSNVMVPEGVPPSIGGCSSDLTSSIQSELQQSAKAQSSILRNLRYSSKASKGSITDDTKKRPREGVKKVRIKEAHGLETTRPKEPRAQSMPIKEISTSPEEMIKIFLLLLQPHAKIFELIQLHYPASITTIGDIISLIPCNATEHALGSQKYIGICRPKRRAAEITDLSLLASNPIALDSVGISHGEIFVAIPEGFTAKHVVSLSKQILSNPRIQQLLEKSTPPSRRRSKKDSSSPRVPMAVVQEEPCSDNVNESLRRAQETAAISNAAVLSDLLHTSLDSYLEDAAETSFANSQTSFSSQLSYANRAILGGNYDEDKSLQGSYTSWSKSFDSSVASVRRRRVSSPAVLRTAALASAPAPRLRRSKNKFTVGAFGAGSFIFMILRYYFDSSYLPTHCQREPMGVTGMIQFVCCFVLLVKLQRLILRTEGSGPTKCPLLNLSPSRPGRRNSQF